MQYTSGTANVVNGSNIVTGNSNDFLTNASVGDSFKIKGDLVVYDVASIVQVERVDGNGDPLKDINGNTLMSTQLHLSTPYEGATASFAQYQLTRDFTSGPLNLIKINPGDQDWAVYLGKDLEKINSAWDAVSAAADAAIDTKIAAITTDFLSKNLVSHGETHTSSGVDTIPLAVAYGASGLFSGTEKAKLDGIAIGATANTGTVTGISVENAHGFFGSATNSKTPIITIGTTITGLLAGDGESLVAATSGAHVKTVGGASILGSGNIPVQKPIAMQSTAPTSPAVGDLWIDPNATSTNVPMGTAPNTATSAGTVGDLVFTSTYIYVCVATNTWKRAALSSW